MLFRLFFMLSFREIKVKESRDPTLNITVLSLLREYTSQSTGRKLGFFQKQKQTNGFPPFSAFCLQPP